MRVLVLGGYGLIGEAVMRALSRAGHQPIGVGRKVDDAELRMPWAQWRRADIATLVDPASWRPLLDGVDAVVNASGALQDSARDDVADVQSRAIRALIDACKARSIASFVQISASNATANADTAFMRSKAEADDHLRRSELTWFVLRPGLVIAPAAYGATALLRALAAFPCVSPLSHADARVQTVHVDDVAATVIAAINGALPPRADYDVVEPTARILAATIAQFRGWLGLRPVRIVHLPRWVARVSFAIGDALGWLGWRSPMRSTAMREIEASVVGDPSALHAATGASLRSLEQTLADIPSTVQERWFARAWLAKPVAIAILSLFWITSGGVALVKYPAAVAMAEANGFASAPAFASVIVGAVFDIALGLGILWRPWTRIAALAMAATAALYLLIGSIMAPQVWLDPLGAFVKIIPSIGLALMVAALQDER